MISLCDCQSVGLPARPAAGGGGREPGDQSVRLSAGWITSPTGRRNSVPPEQVDGAVAAGAICPIRNTGRALPLRRHRTSRVELRTNQVILFDPAGSVPVGVTPSADLAEDVAIDGGSPAELAGNATVGVPSLADLSGDATIGVASPADIAGVVTISVVSSGDLAGDATIDMADPADAGVASLADLAEVASWKS